METTEAAVAIVGGGVAGLAAARLLSRHGVHCVVLEGSEVIGGRIRTLRPAGWPLPVELGAEFVHGRPSPTFALGGGALPLSPVAERRVELGAEPRPMPGTFREFGHAMQPAIEVAATVSVEDYLARAELDQDQQALVRNLVEGYHAAPLGDVSAQKVAEDAQVSAEDFPQYRVVGGYDRVITELEHGISAGIGRIVLGARVTRVTWSRGKVRITARRFDSELQIDAERCLITASIGVLARTPELGGIDFQPYPDALKQALAAVGMGDVVKVVLCFQRAPWSGDRRLRDAGFFHKSSGQFPTFWREGFEDWEQLTAWAGGPRATELARSSPEQVREAAIDAIAEGFAVDAGACRRALVAAHYHDFVSDPLVHGAYSYPRPADDEALRALRAPLEGTLAFAGEAFDMQYPSTVAGALGSGEHAARLLLRACQTK